MTAGQEIARAGMAQRNYSETPRFMGAARRGLGHPPKEHPMNGIIYLIGLIVVIMAILSFFGLR